MNLKPIETIYDGYRFRSRLEARWAVFFDALGIKFEYEKEGYDLGNLGWYLPDFWLPEFKMFIEIKPYIGVPINKETEAHKKLLALQEMTTFPTLLCMGNPKEFWNLLYICDFCDSGGGYSEFDATFAFDTEPILIVNEDRADRSLWTTEREPLDRIVTLYEVAKKRFRRAYGYKTGIKELLNQILEDEFYTTNISENTDSFSCRAAVKARQARFEYGERGAI